MQHLTYRLFIFISIFILTLTACAGVTYHAEPPMVNIAGIQLKDAQLLEQRYELTLRIQNPNETALYIKGLSYNLDINGSEFANGVSNQPIAVPAYGEEMLTASLVSTTLGVINQLNKLSQESKQSLNYRLAGKVSLGTPEIGIDVSQYALHVFPIPFEKTGTMDFGNIFKQ